MAMLGCGVATLGCGVDMLGRGVAMLGCGVAMLGCGLAMLGCGAAISVSDPDPGSGAFLTPGSGIRNRFFPDPGSRIPDPKTIFLRPF
jgi:hypothetical protein